MSITLDGYLNQNLTIVRPKKGAYASKGDVDVLYENVPCRLVESGESKWDPTVNAQITLGSAQAWLDGHYPKARVGDKVLAEEEVEYTILTKKAHRDIDGNPDHTKLVLQ